MGGTHTYTWGDGEGVYGGEGVRVVVGRGVRVVGRGVRVVGRGGGLYLVEACGLRCHGDDDDGLVVGFDAGGLVV